jgi:hypothetical protein
MQFAMGGTQLSFKLTLALLKFLLIFRLLSRKGKKKKKNTDLRIGKKDDARMNRESHDACKKTTYIRVF